MPTALAAETEVERKSGLTHAEFLRDHLYPRRPVVLAGALRDWPAVNRWTPDYFRERFPDREVVIHRKTYRLAHVIDMVEASDESNPAPYLISQQIDEVFPELLQDVQPFPVYATPNWLSGWFPVAKMRKRMHRDGNPAVFIGGKGAGFPVMHYDEYHYHSFVCQVYGHKKFYIYPPDQTEFLYTNPQKPNFSQVTDVENPDLGRFPLFAEAVPTTCVLGPGDLLHTPSGWWHTTKMLGPSITVAVNTANRANWRAVVRDLVDEARTHHPKLAVPLWGYLKGYGAWKSLKEAVLGV